MLCFTFTQSATVKALNLFNRWPAEVDDLPPFTSANGYIQMDSSNQDRSNDRNTVFVLREVGKAVNTITGIQLIWLTLPLVQEWPRETGKRRILLFPCEWSCGKPIPEVVEWTQGDIVISVSRLSGTLLNLPLALASLRRAHVSPSLATQSLSSMVTRRRRGGRQERGKMLEKR